MVVLWMVVLWMVVRVGELVICDFFFCPYSLHVIIILWFILNHLNEFTK